MLPHTVLFRLAFTVRVAFRTPRVSGTGDAHCISRGFTFLSNCVVQRMRAWSLPALLFLSEPVCRSVGRRPEARAHGGKATRPHPLRHPSRRISLGSRRSSARCARTAPDSPLRVRVVSACGSGHGTGGNFATLKQVSEVRSIGSTRKDLQRCRLGVHMHGPSLSGMSGTAVGGPGSPHSDSVFPRFLGQIQVPT